MTVKFEYIFPGPCPEGYFCPQKTGTPVDCPAGTYSNQTGLTASAQCTSCDYGKETCNSNKI